MSDFLDIDKQIEMNEERLAFYHTSYEKTLTKSGLLVLIYSAVMPFLIQLSLFTWGLVIAKDESWIACGMYLVTTMFLCFLVVSIFAGIKMIIPKEIAYQEMPQKFYDDVKNVYIAQGTAEADLDSYIKYSYLKHLEQCLAHNRTMYERKNKLFYRALINAVFALIPFLIALSIYKHETVEVHKVNIENLNELYE